MTSTSSSFAKNEDLKREIISLLCYVDPDMKKYLSEVSFIESDLKDFTRIPKSNDVAVDDSKNELDGNQMIDRILYPLIEMLAAKDENKEYIICLLNKFFAKKFNIPFYEHNENDDWYSYDPKFNNLSIHAYGVKDVSVDDSDSKTGELEGPPFHGETLSKRMPNFTKVLRQPRDFVDLVKLMTEAIKNKTNIKAMGTRYGFGDVTFTTGILIDMCAHMKNPSLPIIEKVLNDYGIKILSECNLLLVEGGAIQEDIGQLIWPIDARRLLVNSKTKKPYKMMKDTTGYSYLNISGTIQVGATGMGTPEQFGALSLFVLSFTLLTASETGELCMVQVERSPKSGRAIHDPKAFKKYYDGSDPVLRPKMELIQDDEQFSSLISSAGTCGVVYSWFIELQDAQFLVERRYLDNWQNFTSKSYAEIIADKDNIRYEFWLVPYTSRILKKARNSPVVVISTYQLAKIGQIPPKIINWKNGGSLRGPQSVSLLGGAVNVYLANHLPDLSVITLIAALFTSCHKEPLVMAAVDVLKFGNANGVPVNATGYGREYVNMNSATSSIDGYIAKAKELRSKNRKQIITVPIAMRYSAPAPGYLSFENETSLVWYEQPILDFSLSKWPNIGTTPFMNDTLLQLQKMFFDDYQCMPHLGLDFFTKNNIWRNHPYKNFGKFLAVYRKFNCLKLFSNQFTKESGLDGLAFG